MKTITWEDFRKIEFRVGTILEVESFREAINPAYKLTVDFGEEIGTKKTSAQITDLYDESTLCGKQVLAVVNLGKKQIGPMMSECLITGFHGEDGNVVLAVADKEVPNGTRLA